MPRISAATVADHRASQHAALLEAAMEILVAEGPGALTPAAVGAKVGLARSSVYRYFSSTAGILAQLVEEAIPRWAGRLRAVSTGDGTLEERVRAFGAATLEFVRSPDHVLLRTLASVELPAECQERVDQLHETMIEPLRDMAAEAGHAQPDLVAHLAWSVLGEGQRRLAAGGPSEVVTPTTLDVLCRAIIN
ncbi:TetR/AcrR family transcriptional regulator [Nonomuraea sp. NBC_01738]|uniref:TetR/AcrR family transcriptional regulator n=1 Tax=Nonomuraea sp. NBC_01738 TaxID=2976003 RepID=UPI002E11EADB|nr:TetR/AcrR family transcriptional regulator [Nonomuraea sp. NBC_01738]